MKKLATATGVISFLLAYGIVGKLDHGGDMKLALWIIPLLLITFISARVLKMLDK